MPIRTTKELLDKIDEFRTATGMSESEFGRRSCGNSKLLPRLMSEGKTPRGHSVTIDTANKILEFMDSYKRPESVKDWEIAE